MLKTFIFDGNMLKNMNTLVQVEYPFCWLATPKENTNITMKKGAKKEPSGEWGVRGSFLRVFFAMANLHRIVQTLHFIRVCMYLRKKNPMATSKRIQLCALNSEPPAESQMVRRSWKKQSNN